MKEKLIIKNFGPIKSVDLDLGKMNILIGESASGKSTVAKVLAICRDYEFLYNSLNASIEGWKSNEGRKDVYKSLDYWGMSNYLSLDSKIYYECDKYSVDLILYENLDFNNRFHYFNLISKDEKITISINNVIKLNNGGYGVGSFPDPLDFASKVFNEVFYFPTERGLQSIFSLGQKTISELQSNLFNQFSLLDNISRRFSDKTIIEPLDLEYYNTEGKGYIRNNSQSDFSLLSNGASGYQSTIPIVLIIKYYSEWQERKRTFIIEEPELNLYPKAQKKLVEFLTFSINDFDHQMLLTTHSPYILTALENLMYAHKMANIADGKYKEQVKEIVEEKYWINPEDVNVYFLDKEGEVDLMQRDYALINKDYIDSVSDSTNEIFDKLLSIEVAHENENVK